MGPGAGCRGSETGTEVGPALRKGEVGARSPHRKGLVRVGRPALLGGVDGHMQLRERPAGSAGAGAAAVDRLGEGARRLELVAEPAKLAERRHAPHDVDVAHHVRRGRAGQAGVAVDVLEDADDGRDADAAGDQHDHRVRRVAQADAAVRALDRRRERRDAALLLAGDERARVVAEVADVHLVVVVRGRGRERERVRLHGRRGGDVHDRELAGRARREPAQRAPLGDPHLQDPAARGRALDVDQRRRARRRGVAERTHEPVHSVQPRRHKHVDLVPARIGRWGVRVV